MNTMRATAGMSTQQHFGKHYGYGRHPKCFDVVTSSAQATPTHPIWYLLEQAEEYVSVYGSLVSLVQHHNGVLLQITINETLPQQHTICHVLDDCVLTGHVFKTNCVSNLHGGKERYGILV